MRSPLFGYSTSRLKFRDLLPNHHSQSGGHDQLWNFEYLFLCFQPQNAGNAPAGKKVDDTALFSQKTMIWQNFGFMSEQKQLDLLRATLCHALIKGGIMELLRINIDGKTIAVQKGTTLLHAAKSNGINIPTHCYDDSLQPYGACRMCLVEIARGGKKRLVASCLYEVEEGLAVKTRTGEIDKIRKMIIELTWPVLSKYAEEYGAQEGRFKNENGDCTLCGKCLRFCAESKLSDVVYFRGRGIHRDIALTPGNDYDYSIYKKCMSFCAGGRLMNKLTDLWSE